MRYVLIDTANMFFRARHTAFRASDPWEKVGVALHTTLTVSYTHLTLPTTPYV